LLTSLCRADAILKGSIDRFGIFPIAFNQQGRATQRQISAVRLAETMVSSLPESF